MKIIRDPVKLQKISIETAKKNKSIGLVATMGALHAGHVSLIKKSAKQNDITIVSVYVNPIQFGPGEDYKRYPKPVKEDIKKCKENGVDYLFLPTNEVLYKNNFVSYVNVEKLSSIMCALSRPQHFRGVTTIVSKLFNITLADRAYFGLKDYQQYVIIKKMAEDLNFKTKVIGCPIVRQKSGLALSSRNTYLSEKAAEDASGISKILQNAKKMFSLSKNISEVVKYAEKALEQIPESRVEYVQARDADTLDPAKDSTKKILLAVAVRIQNVRLIDNIVFKGE